jgi:mRNA interferase YafQ
MLTLVPKTQFRKDVKKLPSAGLDFQKLVDVIRTLQEGKPLDAKHRDHALTGPWKAFRECHLQGDWLLIYQKTETELILVRTGSHSALFG